MVQLRKLLKKDAPLILEWMKDSEVKMKMMSIKEQSA